MSEPSPKRHKADDGEVAVLNPQIVELGSGDDAADANGDLEGAQEYVVDILAAELEECQKALDKVNDEASDRVLAVEQEYNKKRRPIYAERAEIIKKIPQFWQRVLSSHPLLADHLTDDDALILEYVSELDVVDFDDIKSGFKIVLTFLADNPYFTNSTLTKSFHYGDDAKAKIEPAVIDWTEGHAPTSASKYGMSYLFFTWMSANEPVGDGNPDQISEILKDDIWPNPVKYYYSLLGPDVEDEGAGLEGGDFDQVLARGEEGDEGEDEELVYDEGEGELDAAGVEGAEGEEAFADDGAEDEAPES